MSKRYVTLPNGKACGLACYVDSWRKLREIVARDPASQIRGFDHFADDAARVLRRLRDGMHDRINWHIPRYGVGRKWDNDYQREICNAARAVNTPRLAVHWLPADLRARLSHRLADLD